MTEENRLYDVLTRSQVYIEGVKRYQAVQFSNVLLKLQDELRKDFAWLNFDSLDQMTKAQLYTFTQSLKDSQTKVYSVYAAGLLTMLQDFMDIDANMTVKLINDVNDEYGDPDDAVEYTDKDSNALWSSIINAPIPANGILLKALLNNFINSATATVLNLARQGYANNWTVKETLQNITGSQTANFRDGAFAKFNAQQASLVSTLLQHVSSITKESVIADAYDRYEWVSVLDSHTTEICRSRAGKIYIVDQGPLPPAHFGCRSTIVPVPNDASTSDDSSQQPTTYYAWLKSQPSDIQDDILGTGLAAQLRSGNLKSKDVPSISDVDPLTLDQFAAKLNLILTH